MGLKLRLNLFHGVSAQTVWGALKSFYRGRELSPSTNAARNYRLHEQDGNWCVLEWDSGWEWETRREAQLLVSKRLNCAGLLVFVYDGKYWGYELFENGVVVNRFVQYPPGDGEQDWFPGDSCVGDAAWVAKCFPEIEAEDVAPYLMQMPPYGERDKDYPERQNRPARPGDEFGHFDECSVLDFLRMLGVRPALREGVVAFTSPVYQEFAVRYLDT